MKGGLGNLMKQAQLMQDNMKKLQGELAAMEVEGQSGSGMVRIIMTGRHEGRRGNIDPRLLEGDREVGGGPGPKGGGGPAGSRQGENHQAGPPRGQARHHRSPPAGGRQGDAGGPGRSRGQRRRPARGGDDAGKDGGRDGGNAAPARIKTAVLILRMKDEG